MPAAKELQKDAMMTHLLSALENGKDIGHYGVGWCLCSVLATL